MEVNSIGFHGILGAATSSNYLTMAGFAPAIIPIQELSFSHSVYGGLLAVICALCMAAEGIINRKGIWSTNVWTGNLIRTAAAALGFIFIMFFKGVLGDLTVLITRQVLLLIFFSTFISLFIGDIAYLEAIKRAGVSKALPVSSTYPLFVALLTILIYGKSVDIHIFAGCVFIVLAIYLISENRNLTAGDLGDISKLGLMLALLAGICWASAIIVLDYLVHYLPVEAVVGFRYLMAVMITSTMIPIKGLNLNRYALKYMGAAGIVALLIGNYALIEAIHVAGSVKATPIAATYPIIAALFARLFLKEYINRKTVAGIGLSFTGVLLVVIS